ncbi:MAG: hypothetical protein H7319_09665 [Spirosoma sp.]|nr:hypothetical protein [Spirosoma sp.]
MRQHRCLDGLLVEVKKLLTSLVLHEVFNVLFRVELHQVYLVRLVDLMVDKRAIGWPFLTNRAAC